MAASSSLVALLGSFLVIVTLAALPVQVMSVRSYRAKGKPRSWTWYQYETFGSGTLNDGIGPITNNTLGVVEILEERMTQTAEPNSTYYGRSIGNTAYHYHPDNSIHVQLALSNYVVSPYKGSFTLQGLVNTSAPSSTLVITGGTGFFTLVRGYATTTSVTFGPGKVVVNKWVATFYWF